MTVENSVNPRAALYEELTICPVRHTMGVIGGKWKLLIINELMTGALRFNELRRRVEGVSQRLLTAQLRALEEDGIVAREIKNIMPPHVEYSLTADGQRLSDVITALEDWGAVSLREQKSKA